jgi:predicted ATPase
MKQEITITVSGGNQVGKSSILSMLAVVFSCMQSSTGKPLEFTIDPKSQTMQEGGLITEDQLNANLEAMINGDQLTLTLIDKSAGVILL